MHKHFTSGEWSILPPSRRARVCLQTAPARRCPWSGPRSTVLEGIRTGQTACIRDEPPGRAAGVPSQRDRSAGRDTCGPRTAARRSTRTWLNDPKTWLYTVASVRQHEIGNRLMRSSRHFRSLKTTRHCWCSLASRSAYFAPTKTRHVS